MEYINERTNTECAKNSPVAFISPDPAYGYLGLVMPMDPNGTYNQLALVRL
jgi:hypothetical protein